MNGSSDTDHHHMYATPDVLREVAERRALTAEYLVEQGAIPITSEAELRTLAPEFDGSPWVNVPAWLFRWEHPVTGEVHRQLRPVEGQQKDNGDVVKYAFAEGEYTGLGVVRRPEGTPRIVLLVEGTMQSLAVARYAPADALVIATPGCWGWSHEGMPDPGLAVCNGLPVTVFLDADAATNPDVYDAGTALSSALSNYGAESVVFARLPIRGTHGVDDYTASVPEHDRAAHVERASSPSGNRVHLPADRKPPARKKRRGALGAATSQGLPDPNDTWLATSWADEGAATRWRVLLDANGWLGYRLGRWEPATKLGPYDDVARYCHDISQQWFARAHETHDADEKEHLEETARMLLSHRKIDTVLSRAAGHSDFHVRRSDLDQHPTLWPAGNGVLDLLGPRELREHDPDLLLTAGSDVVYDPDATCPRFDAFLDEVLPDPEVRAYVMRLFGVAMFGEVRANAHVFTVFVGSGRNGKGALVRTMERLFGRMAVTIDPRTLQEARFEGHSQEVAKLAGKRLATAQEPEAGKGWNTGRIKAWTGGDTLTGRFMGQNDFEFAPAHTMIVTANDRPPVPRSDSAFWMRYREVPFEVSVEGREDAGLEAFIADHELPGVLNRVLSGLTDYLRQGLAEPAAVLAATHEAQVESDHLAVFAEQHLVHTGSAEDRLLASDVYGAAQKWWSQHVRHEELPSERGKNNFASQLRRVLGIVEPEGGPRNPRETKIDGGKVRKCWHGLRWLDEGDASPSGALPALPGSVVDVANHGGPDDSDISNRPDTDGPGTDEESPEVVDVDPEVVDVETSSPTEMISISAGHDAEVVEVVEVVDMGDYSRAHAEKVAPIQKGSEEKFSRVEPAIGAYRQLDNRTTLPSATTAPVVFDIETADGDLLHTHPDPEGFVRIGAWSTGGTPEVVTGPGALVERVVSSRKVIGHNVLGFDLIALARVDPRIDLLALARQGRVHDTMITESVLHPILNDGRAGAVGRAQKTFALDATAERYGIPGKTDDLAALAKTHGGYDAIPVDDQAYRSYCAGDVAATTRIAAAQAAEIGRRPAAERDYLAREHRVHAIAATMGAIGLKVDEKLTQDRFWRGYGRKNDLTRSLIAAYGIPTTKADGKPADSPAATRGGKEAVLRALHSLGADISRLEKTKGGAPAFGRDPMARFAAAHEDHPRGEEIAALCSMMGDIAGVRTVYATALEHLHSDGRVHPSVATLQASGRWSVQKPGLTVFGKRAGRLIERDIFTVTDEDHVLFTADFSQIDQRAVAVHSQDPAYMALFEPGKDSHAEVAMRVWGDPKRRSDAKVVGHGWNYGMGLAKLAAEVGSEKTAQEFDVAMREQFPRLVAWREEVREEAAAHGVLDNGFGRRMLVDPDRAHTQAPALMGQGGARDLAMEALLAMPDDIARCLRAFVHDEIVVECHRDDLDEVRREVKRAMNFEWCPPHGTRPIRIEAEPGPAGWRWSQCY